VATTPDSTDLVLSGQAPTAGVVTGSELAELGEIEIRARGYWEQVWRRFKRDKVAIAGGFFIVFLFFAAFAGAPIAQHFLGHGPNDLFIASGGVVDFLPVGPWHHVGYLSPDGHLQNQLFILGADGTLGRDEFLRILYGAQVSLEVGVGAMILSISIGLVMGSIAGYFGGWIDTIISRITEIVMAFPYLLFVIALASTVGTRVDNITFGFLGRGVITLVLVFGLFSWYYQARVFRSIVLSLREKEFVEAARMIGASDWRIIRSHIVPHLVAPIIVFSTLQVAAFILLEAALSFLGLGVKLPTASWGNLLADAPNFYTTRPLLMLWPGIALILTTMSFNLLGDGLRDAFDPRANR
jgi:ABC-type dipeptide/oligopeptide/nickel transport system permease subunit